NEFPFSRRADDDSRPQPTKPKTPTRPRAKLKAKRRRTTPAPAIATDQVTTAQPAEETDFPYIATDLPPPAAAPPLGPPPPIATPGQTISFAARPISASASITPQANAATHIAPELRAGYKGPERRKSPRLPLRAKAIYRSDRDPAAAGPVQLLNVSNCGLRL